MLSKVVIVSACTLIIGLLIGLYVINPYDSLVERYNGLVGKYNDLTSDYNKLNADQNSDSISEDNCTAVTVVYYTNFTRDRRSITLSIPYEKYDAYHEKYHQYWGKDNLALPAEYITFNETIINQIVTTIENQTQSEEELANALLDFVQYKERTMSIRYYPTTELKYPIETLVEMGGDCDTHSFLYATLMKAAGFKVVLLFSNEKLSDGQYHVATAVHLDSPPIFPSSISEKALFAYNGEDYYFAETTGWARHIGEIDEVSESGNLTYQIIPV